MIMTGKLEKSDGLPNDSFLIPIWQILTFGKVENFLLSYVSTTIISLFLILPFQPLFLVFTT